MKEITANLNNYRQSPRKVRVVADAIRGKSIAEAKAKLSFIIKRASNPLNKLLNSAIANAKDLGASPELLFVKSITVNQGKILYRSMPVAHGSANPIRKRVSRVAITLIEKQITNNKSQITKSKKVNSDKLSVKS